LWNVHLIDLSTKHHALASTWTQYHERKSDEEPSKDLDYLQSMEKGIDALMINNT